MTRRTIATLGIVLSCLAALLAPSPAAAMRAGTDWRNLSYVHYDDTGYYFAVMSNAELWNAYRVTNVPTGFSPGYPIPEQMRDGKQIEAIWGTKKCSATKGQKVTLSRSVQLPGTPGTLLLNVQRRATDYETLHQGKFPISSVEVRLNGVKVATLKGKKDGVNAWKTFDLSGFRDSVVPGTNTVTILATKAKTKKSNYYCYSKTPDFGVALELVGRPVSDMQVSVGTLTATTIGLLMKATVLNAGPSVAATPSFSVSTGQELGGANVTDLDLGYGNTDCPASSTGEGMAATCWLPDLAPGESVEITLIIKWTMTCPGAGTVHYRYNAFNLWQDTNRADNGRDDAGATCPPT